MSTQKSDRAARRNEHQQEASLASFKDVCNEINVVIAFCLVIRKDRLKKAEIGKCEKNKVL